MRRVSFDQPKTTVKTTMCVSPSVAPPDKVRASTTWFKLDLVLDMSRHEEFVADVPMIATIAPTTIAALPVASQSSATPN